MSALGWDVCDIILISGDAYIDHPAFGTALIGRLLAALGYRVGIIAQPDVSTSADFSRLGAPRLFWGVTAGNVDSRLSQLTVMRKRRHDDPYSPEGAPNRRPPNASLVYTARVRQVAAGGAPVVLGGLEASLRRFAYYDYWTDKVRRSILFDAKAELLAYGMAERAVLETARRCRNGEPLTEIAGTAAIAAAPLPDLKDFLRLPSYEDLRGPQGMQAYLDMSRHFLKHGTGNQTAATVQAHGTRFLIAYPEAAALSSAEMDFLYGLPFTRRPHPAYGNTRIPAYEMIRDSVTTHRGCFGGCAFCAIGVHQGARISSRSPENILEEIRRIAAAPGFRGTITDLGGPTANMYGTGCRLPEHGCPSPHCLYPETCPNLETDQRPLTGLLQRARKVAGVHHVFCASGIRPDLAMGNNGAEYLRELAAHHVGGRLKIAPEHVVPHVLQRMRKPTRAHHDRFLAQFHRAAAAANRRYPVVEYYLSGHPGCTLDDMLELALFLRDRGIRPEQVQDFYPAPLTCAAAMYYTGMDPTTGKPVFTARTDREKADQRALLLCHLPEYHARARTVLKAMGRADLIGLGPSALTPPAGQPHRQPSQKSRPPPHHRREP